MPYNMKENFEALCKTYGMTSNALVCVKCG